MATSRRDLFPVRADGHLVEPAIVAAQALSSPTLDPTQREAVSFPVDSDVWRHWSNIHRNLMRHGLCLAELSEDQRASGLRAIARGAWRCAPMRRRATRCG